MLQQFPLLLLQVHVLVQQALLTKKKETHLNIWSSNSQAWQDLNQAFNFLWIAHMPTKGSSHEYFSACLAGTAWAWTNTSRPNTRRGRSTAKGKERACRTVALFFFLDHLLKKLHELLRYFWKNNNLHVGESYSDDSKSFVVRWKNWTNTLLTCCQRQKCPSSLENLAAKMAGTVLKPGCLTSGFWKAVWKWGHFVSVRIVLNSVFSSAELKALISTLNCNVSVWLLLGFNPSAFPSKNLHDLIRFKNN